ncbi:MAG: hypothetical protein JWQ57_898 [Mucilaginibacter sp.]|nr:hypothetical protein [Mucilaginibacter sp.]
MENDVLFKLIDKLPLNSKAQVEHLVIHLIQKAKDDLVEIDLSDIKGGIMAEDFDAPLKEFHDYMYTMDIEFIEKIEKLPVPLQKKLESITDEMLTDIKSAS